MKTALVIMAAGIGSRFGGVKQLEPVGIHQETIMDYSVHDAIAAGFDKIIFVIRREMQETFHKAVGERLNLLCSRLGVETGYAYQSLEDLPEKIDISTRQKPWGTGQAVLACKRLVQEPFGVINADDFYGRESFVKLHRFLSNVAERNTLCMVGYALENTLSEHGGVSRGICRVDEKGYLTDVTEIKDIVKTPKGIQGAGMAIDAGALVSMNLWGFTPAFMELLEADFREFLSALDAQSVRNAEYMLPVSVNRFLKEGRVSVKVLKTKERWFGFTYQQDKSSVVSAIEQKIAQGVYQADLYSDLYGCGR